MMRDMENVNEEKKLLFYFTKKGKICGKTRDKWQ
jgi:hypothetical protein